MSSPNSSPAPAEPTLLPMASAVEAKDLLATLDATTAGYRCNLPLDQEWARTWFLKVGAPPDYRLEQLTGKDFCVTHYHAKVVPVTLSESGEIVPRIMVTLFDTEGKTVAWTSEITTSKFGLFLQSYGTAPWNPPVPLKVQRVPGKKTGHWYYFDAPIKPMPKAKAK